MSPSECHSNSFHIFLLDQALSRFSPRKRDTQRDTDYFGLSAAPCRRSPVFSQVASTAHARQARCPGPPMIQASRPKGLKIAFPLIACCMLFKAAM
jgi:hypothetical protein